MTVLQNGFLPALLVGIVLYAYLHEVEVFSTFVQGAKKGLHTAVSILPTMIGMITAVYMLRACGAIDLAAYALSPILSWLGIPAQCAPLVLLGPVSGSGALALGSELIARFGADSLPGRTAAVMLGSSETSLYTLGLYGSHIKLSKMRYALPAALLADLTACIFSSLLVKLFYPLA